jgi:hypothetical protein
MSIKIMTAPGPVCFPLLAVENKDIEVKFGKDGNSDIILDSSISLMKRRLPIHMVLLSGLSMVSPDFRGTTAVLRKGGASDVLSKIIVRSEALPVDFVYGENMEEIKALMNKGKATSAVVMSMSGMKGITLEERAMKSGFYVPGSCAASFEDRSVLNEFKQIYNEGLEEFRKNPEKAAETVSKKLPNKFPLEFIIGIMKSMKPIMEEPEDYSKLEVAVLNA